MRKKDETIVIDNYEYEKKLYEEGFSLICGTDEVGRGPLVGPVVASAVIMPKNVYIEGVTDSKKISEKKRIELKKIIEEKALAISTIFIDARIIDEINIYEASRLAMTKAIESLNVEPDYILSDAMKLSIKNIPNLPLIKGDLKSFSIGCASIIAKVERDEYMKTLDEKYPMYNFKKNKGYPTKEHLQAISTYGIIDEHRKSYGPVKKKIEEENKLTLFDFLDK